MKESYRIPLSAPELREEDVEAVVAVLRTSQLSLGPKVPEFEKALAAVAGCPHAVAVSSGTAGLHLCVRALGIGDGDEVILPSFTFVAAANALRYERAVPVFVDVEAVTLNLDPRKIEEALTPRTKAILVPHTFGCPADMREIGEIARRHDLLVIEDACEAIGAEYEGRRVGALGDAGVFAFYPNKQLTTGEGGAVVTRNGDLAAQIASLRNHGRAGGSGWLEHLRVGFNYRLSDIACALGVAQLARIEEVLARREAVARRYHERLRGREDLVLPPLDVPKNRISWFVFVVRLTPGLPDRARDAVWERLRSRGIGCGRYFAPIHMQPAYSHPDTSRCSDLAVTESEAKRCLALPFFNAITNDQLDEVCRELLSALDEIGTSERP